MEFRSRLRRFSPDIVPADRKVAGQNIDTGQIRLLKTIRSLRSTLAFITHHYRFETSKPELKAKSNASKFRFSNRNRAKFQRKMSSKNNSPNLLSQSSGPKYTCPHESCEKVYKLEGALKNHLAKMHGEEESVLGESKFEPQDSSTSHMVEEDKRRGLKRTREDEVSDTDDEDFEDAIKSKDARRDYVERLNLQRDYDLGFDIGAEDTLIGKQVEDTQTLLNRLTDSVKKAETHDVSASVLAMSANDSVELGINNNVELKTLEDKVRLLEGVIHERDTKIMDLEVVIREQGDMMDERDRKLKEQRKVVKLKQSEISELLRDKELNNIKMKKSPLKEALKLEADRAQRRIVAQDNRIRNLEKQNDELSKHVKVLEKEQPDVAKLKKSVADSLSRAEHYTREREDLHNTIAGLKKKIPCFNIATCDLGKRCHFSHVLKYSMQLNNLKNIPCVHYIDNRCKFSADECKYSHEEKFLNGKQRKQFLENRMLEDISEEEDADDFFCNDNLSSKYETRADRSRPPRSKRLRTISSDTSETSAYNTDATRYFPDPVPAISRRRSTTAVSPRSQSSRRSYSNVGNSYGARAKRSDPESPARRRGSQSRGGRRGSSRGRTRSPAPSRSFGRSQSPRSSSNKRGPKRGSKEGSRRHSDRR